MSAQQQTHYSESRSIWFGKVSGIHQPLVAFPLIGYVSAYQALLIFGLALPVFFGMMSHTGQMHYSIIPALGIAIFAMIRPPVISYEGRLFAMVLFYIHHGSVPAPKKPKLSKKGTRSSVLAKPSTLLKKATDKVEKIPTPPAEKMTMHVSPSSLTELTIILKDRDANILRRRKVKILLDGSLIRADRSSTSGEISITLMYDECIGTRNITVMDVGDGGTIAEKKVTFIRPV